MSDAVSLAQRRVWISGSGGFLGSTIVRSLVDAGADVRALLGPPGAAVVPPPAEVVTAHAEIDDVEALRPTLEGVEIAVHLAGPPSVARSFEDPVHFARAHVCGTAAVLDACRHAGVARVVHVSSAEVYGQPRRNPVAEDHPLRASSPYGAAKIGAEQFVRAAGVSGWFRTAVLRPFSIYGPGQSPRSLPGAILRQVLNGASCIELANLEPVRDYCFVEDVAAAVVRACAVTLPDAVSVFNIASGRGVSVEAFAHAVSRAAGRDVSVRASGGDRPPSANILELVADVSRADRELGWRSRTGLDEGLSRTVEWGRAQATRGVSS